MLYQATALGRLCPQRWSHAAARPRLLAAKPLCAGKGFGSSPSKPPQKPKVCRSSCCAVVAAAALWCGTGPQWLGVQLRRPNASMQGDDEAAGTPSNMRRIKSKGKRQRRMPQPPSPQQQQPQPTAPQPGQLAPPMEDSGASLVDELEFEARLKNLQQEAEHKRQVRGWLGVRRVRRVPARAWGWRGGGCRW